jgi:hypothetical protein
MDCDRAFLSLIDNRSQFICAEMTRHQSLFSPDPNEPLLLGTARIALEWGVCPYTMSTFHGKPVCLPDSPYIVADKSYFCIKDFRQISTFAARPFVTGYPSMVSYIEIPLTSISGHILGSYCVVDNRERDFLHPDSMRIIRETTSAISQYLNMKRADAGKSRSERMMDGLRHFVGTERRDSLLGTGASSSSAIPAGPFDLDVFSSASQTDVLSHKPSRIELAQSSDVSHDEIIRINRLNYLLSSVIAKPFTFRFGNFVSGGTWPPPSSDKHDGIHGHVKFRSSI